MPERVEVFRDRSGEYRWRRIAVNEEQVSESGEGYVRKIDAVRMARDLNPDLADAIFDIEVREARADQ